MLYCTSRGTFLTWKVPLQSQSLSLSMPWITNDTKPGRAANLLGDNQDPDRPEHWLKSDRNSIEFVLGHKLPKYMMGEVQIESAGARKDQKVLVDGKLTQQWERAFKDSNMILRCLKWGQCSKKRWSPCPLP